ncbi:MAG: IS66 family transposase, partial [bacterium]
MDNLKHLEEIKNDPKALYDFTLSLLKTVDNLDEEKLKLENEVVVLNEKLKLFQKRTFGKSSEKTPSNCKEFNLFTQDGYEHFNEAEANSDNTSFKPIDENTGRIKRVKGKNFVNAVDLETEEKHYELNDLSCDKCNGVLESIGTKETYSLKVIPAKLIKVKNIQHTYKCSCCDETNIITAPKKNPFIKTMVEPSFVADIIYKKYFLSIPLYRQEKDFRQFGLDIRRNNLSNWFISGAKLLEHLYKIMHKDILNSNVAHVDETTVTVINKKNKPNSLSYMWLLRSSKHDDQSSLYFYKDSREHHHAKVILDGFKGYLHSDCYEAYFKLNDVTNVACIAHLRRKFIEVQDVTKTKDMKGTLSSKALLLINYLYRIEHRLEQEIKERQLNKEESFKLIYETRQRKSKWALNKLKQGYDKYFLEVLPNSKLGKAFTYFVNNYEYFCNYIL